MVNFDSRITRLPPDLPVVRECDYCHEEMREGEEVIQTFDGDVIHEFCLSDYVWEYIVFRRGYLNREGYVE